MNDRGDTTTPLYETAHIFTGPPLPAQRIRTALQESGEFEACLVTVAAIEVGRIDPSELRLAYVDRPDQLEPYLLRSGDVVVAARSTRIRCAIIPPELEGTVATASVIAIRCDTDRLHPRLLRAYFEHSEGNAALMSASQSTTTQLSLSVRSLEQIQVPIPPASEQAKLVALLEAADAQREAAESSIHIRYRLAQHFAVSGMTMAKTDDGDKSK